MGLCGNVSVWLLELTLQWYGRCRRRSSPRLLSLHGMFFRFIFTWRLFSCRSKESSLAILLNGSLILSLSLLPAPPSHLSFSSLYMSHMSPVEIILFLCELIDLKLREQGPCLYYSLSVLFFYLNFAASNNTHVLHISFCGSRVRAWASRVLCSGLRQVEVNTSAKLQVHLRHRVLFQASSVSGRIQFLMIVGPKSASPRLFFLTIIWWGGILASRGCPGF